MNKIKNSIILMITMIIVLLIIILIIFINLKKKNNIMHHIPENEIDTQGDDGEVLEITNEEVVVDNMSTIKTVESVIQRYFDTINRNSSRYYGKNDKDEYIKVISDEEIKQQVLELLSDEYKNSNSINISNIDTKIELLDEDVEIIALQMKEVINENIEKFCVNAIAINNEYKMKNNFCMFVNLDFNNKTFSIEPIDDIDKSFDELRVINNNTPITPSNNNMYKMISFGYEQTINKYINDFKKIFNADLNISYNYLNEDYKKEKFQNINDYKNYVIMNKNRFQVANIDKYRVNYSDEYTEFVCIDQNEYYYIIRQQKNNPLKYSIILDTYTLALPEFIEKYDKANDQQKIGMNIEKIVSAINCKDYEYIYSRLDNTFKQNNYGTINMLKEAMNSNLFDINKAEYKTFNDVGGGIYSYNIQIHQLNNETNNKNMTIVMKLLENRDFVMSFSFD